MKNILIMGSTGSIGKNALEVVRHARNSFKITGLTAHSNIALLREQIQEFEPKYVCVGKFEDYKILKGDYPQIDFFCEDNGLSEIAQSAQYDILLTAIPGFIAIDATVQAIKREKTIALANKETMVAAGAYINFLLSQYNAKIIPVDSEHSAIFQALNSNSKKDVKRIILTASGGPFRDFNLDSLKNVKPSDALKHPNWNMGKKVSIDSATLVNKGLEVIEAHEIFQIPYEKIETLLHRESIIHSMVEYVDGSILAQMGVTSMKTPILYSFTYPHRMANEAIDFIDFKKMSKLSFEELRTDVFKGVDLAYRAGKTGKTMPCVFNASNEVAVELYLGGKISFLDIYKIIEAEMDSHEVFDYISHDATYKLKTLDNLTRKRVFEKWGR